jgi:transposase-like protein
MASLNRMDRSFGKSLGVSVWRLKRWSKIYGTRGESRAVKQGSELELENAKLRRELETVSRQRDILKKALGILGQEPNNFTR